MFKKIIILLIVVIILFAGAVFYAASNAGKLVAKFKPSLEQTISSTTGFPIKLGNIDVSIFPITGLDIKELQLGAGDGIKLKDLKLKLSLAELLKGSLKVLELSLDKPEISILKSATGIEIVGLKLPAAKSDPASKTTETKNVATQVQIPDSIKLDLQKFAITNAKLNFEDSTSNQKASIDQIQLETSVDSAGNLIKVPNFNFSCSLMNKFPISAIAKGIAFDLGTKQLTLPELGINLLDNPVKIKLDHNLAKMEGRIEINSPGIKPQNFLPIITEYKPSLAGLIPSGSIIPEIIVEAQGTSTITATGNINLKDLALQIAGFAISQSNADINIVADLNKQSASSKNIEFLLNGTKISADFDASASLPVVNLKELNAKAFGGAIKLDTELNSLNQSFKSNININGIKIEEAVPVLAPQIPVGLTGVLTQFTANVAGGLSGIPNSVSGTSSVQLNNAAIKDLNIAGEVWKKLKELPAIGASLDAAINPEHKAILDASDTKIDSLTGDFQIASGRLNTNNLKIMSNIFNIAAKGSTSFTGNIDMATQFSFSPAFSASLIAKVKEFKYLENNGQIVFPVTISGQAPKLLVLPDLEELTKILAKGAAKEKAGEFIDKTLGDKAGSGKDVIKGLLGF